MKRLQEILRLHRNWDLLVLIRGSNIKVYDILDTANSSYEKYIDCFSDVICNYVMFNYGCVNLLIITMEVDIDKLRR